MIKWDKKQFVEDVYALVRLVPEGRVTSYGAIAKALSQARQSRMVGYALNRCPDDVPAHRVVNRNGVLTGRVFFGGDRMAMLLRAEGVTVKDNKVQQFKHFFGNPLLEL